MKKEISSKLEKKVMSNHHVPFYGKMEKKHFIALGFAVIAVLGFVFFQANLSGNVILKLDADYHEGENLDGILKLSLNNGELIPASSKVIFETPGRRREFILEDIISEQPVEGTYYIQGKNFSGQGMGYGLTGTKKIYPEISFAFNVYSEPEETEEEKPEKQIEDVAETINETKSAEIKNETSEQIEEVIKEKNETEVAEASDEANIIEMIKDEEAEVEEETEEEVEEKVEEIEEEEVEEIEEVEETEEVEEEEEIEEDKETEEEPTITGRVISAIYRSFASLLHLTPTGQVTLNIETVIPGKVSADSPFVYNLEKGQTAELISGSVTHGSETLSDSDINFEVSDSSVLISTDYSEAEDGFGVNYLEDEFRDFQINLSAIDLNFTRGDLNISFVYGGEEIIFLSAVLQEGKINKSNESTPIEIPGFSPQNLTEDEKQILIHKFGNVSVKTTRAEVLNGRLIRNYKIGNYELTASYDYDSDTADSLEEQMEKDKLNFLRDLIRMISEKKTASENVGEFLGSSAF